MLVSACFNLRSCKHTMLQNGTELGEPVLVLGLLWDKNEDV
jgi:hypothetical protein